MFACMLVDIFENFTGSEVLIIGDENYGACTIEDVGGFILDCDFIIHYGEISRTQLPSANTGHEAQGDVRLR